MRRRLDTRGAVFVEYLIAFMPIMTLFASTWQIADLYAAHLIVKRAASAAGRAASVVLPDDRFYYDGVEENSYSGARRTQIELAANLILRASPRILANPEIRVEGAAGNGPLTVTIEADLKCFPGWGMFVCGADGIKKMRTQVRYPYHGASYGYE